VRSSKPDLARGMTSGQPPVPPPSPSPGDAAPAAALRGPLALRRTLTAYLFLCPALALLAAFTFYPVVFGTGLSLFEYNAIAPPLFVGLANFHAVWRDRYFWIALSNSVKYLAVVPVLQAGAIVLALGVHRSARGLAWLRAAYYVPVVTSIVVVGILWRWIYDDAGLINFVLLRAGLTRVPVHWLSSPEIALYAVMFVTLWKGLGYYMVIYLAGLEAIPPGYAEAAAIDGAGPLQQLYRVTIPLLRPSILLATTLSAISALRVFEEVYVMTGGGPVYATYTMFYYMFDQAFGALHLGYAAALGVVLAVVTIGLSIANFRILREGGLSYY
jgi:putative chitobiose transport system permease protein